MKDVTALIIMDGFGISQEKEGNAVCAAKTPNFDMYWNEYPSTTIGAAGMDVGLPDGQMGNSEVGHLNIGAGRIVYQELTRISKAIDDGVFFENPVLLQAMRNVKAKGTNLHLFGLLSDGGVHSHNTHLYAMLKMAKSEGLGKVFVHCFMDGRDTPPQSGKKYIEELEVKIAEIGTGRIATVMGRYYAMDRDNRWERVKAAYDALTLGKGKFAQSAVEIMENSYNSGVNDEFVLPGVVLNNGQPTAVVGAEDSVIFFNFRPDRSRQLSRAFIETDFSGFSRDKGYFPVHFVSLTQYDETFENICVAYEPQSLANTFGEYISSLGKKQLRIAETEKYAHVTFFFNGGVEPPNKKEDRALIPSPKVATYDHKPSMSAYEVADEAVIRIESGEYDVMILNFANCDMVGHTGIMEAAVKAVETVDICLGKVVEAIRKCGGRAIITADHGNAEMMLSEDKKTPHTAHTTNPVPCILVDDKLKDVKLKTGGRLCDLAPTMLGLLGIEKPAEMTGKSMIDDAYTFRCSII